MVHLQRIDADAVLLELRLQWPFGGDVNRPMLNAVGYKRSQSSNLSPLTLHRSPFTAHRYIAISVLIPFIPLSWCALSDAKRMIKKGLSTFPSSVTGNP